MKTPRAVSSLYLRVPNTTDQRCCSTSHDGGLWPELAFGMHTVQYLLGADGTGRLWPWLWRHSMARLPVKLRSKLPAGSGSFFRLERQAFERQVCCANRVFTSHMGNRLVDRMLEPCSTQRSVNNQRPAPSSDSSPSRRWLKAEWSRKSVQSLRPRGRGGCHAERGRWTRMYMYPSARSPDAVVGRGGNMV